MKKFIIGSFLFLFASVTTLKSEPLGKVTNTYNSLNCKALVDSINNSTTTEKTIEKAEGKASLFTNALISKKDSSLPYILETIGDTTKDWKTRFILVEAIPSVSKNPEVAEKLARILKSKQENSYVRGRCALSLGYIGLKEYTPVIIEALKDKSVYVKERALWGLDILKDSTAIQPLIECMNDPNYMVQVLAIQTLGHLKAKEAILPLKEKLEATDIPEYPEIVKHKVIQAISNIGGPEAQQILLNTLTDQSGGDLRIVAADGLQNYKDEKVIQTLLSALKADDELLRLHSARKLVNMRYPNAKAVIQEAINNTKDEYIKTMMEKIIK